MIRFEYDDGGRAAAGFSGDTGDCGVRAIAIALEKPYKAVYDDLTARQYEYLTRKAKRARSARKRRHWQKYLARGRTIRYGLFRDVSDAYLAEHGWAFTATMHIGSGTTVHLRADELPAGRLIARLSKHVCAVVDGVVRDTYDPSRGGTRCVYGYYREKD